MDNRANSFNKFSDTIESIDREIADNIHFLDVISDFAALIALSFSRKNNSLLATFCVRLE